MKISLVWMALSFAGLAACGGGSDDGSGGAGGDGGAGGGPTACAEHPLECPAGETCWFAGETFGCLPSGAGTLGETCSPFVGKATCADDLLCVKKTGADAGACVALCDATLGGDQCGDLFCVPVELASGEQTHVCM